MGSKGQEASRNALGYTKQRNNEQFHKCLGNAIKDLFWFSLIIRIWFFGLRICLSAFSYYNYLQ